MSETNTFGFNDFINSLEDIINNYESEAKDFIEGIQVETVANAILNTPVISGNLKRSWNWKPPEKTGNTISGEVGSDGGIAPYARAVELGKSTPSGGWIPGQFILTKQVEKMNDEFENRAVDFFNDLTSEVRL